MNRHPSTPRRRGGLGSGTTSLLVIFTLLCLATLALLSLATAQSDARIRQRGGQMAHSLAAAEGVAAGRLAVLDAALADAPPELEARLACLEALGCTVDRETATARFTVPVHGDTQMTLTLGLAEPGGGRYRLLSQLVHSGAEWQPQPGGEVWQPGE